MSVFHRTAMRDRFCMRIAAGRQSLNHENDKRRAHDPKGEQHDRHVILQKDEFLKSYNARKSTRVPVATHELDPL